MFRLTRQGGKGKKGGESGGWGQKQGKDDYLGHWFIMA